MRVLLIGDIVGEPGRRAVEQLVPQLREQHRADLVIANGENATRGLGLSARHAKQLLGYGVDAITLGNHAYRQRDILPFLNADARIVRPANLPAASPGTGLMFVESAAGLLAVINVMGSLYLDVAASPFAIVDDLVEQARVRTNAIVVDMHAEATSEKVAIGHYLKGRVSAVVGTHTHVQTSDARILGEHTAYMTDLGMTGPHDSVIGVRADIILRKFTTGIGERFEPATGGVQLEGAVLELDAASGKAVSIEALRAPLPVA